MKKTTPEANDKWESSTTQKGLTAEQLYRAVKAEEARYGGSCDNDGSDGSDRYEAGDSYHNDLSGEDYK